MVGGSEVKPRPGRKSARDRGTDGKLKTNLTAAG